ncbi:MAG: PVC-type heme-binding CxxCH protein [Verrucomicrobiota bacterium]
MTGLIAFLISFACGVANSFAALDGSSPSNPTGRPLNFNFEDGSLKHWTAQGEAFAGQPVKGDLVAKRNGPGGTSHHQGEFWIGGYEIGGDDLKGTLTSEPFKVTQPFASFLVAGGHWPETRVELVDAKSQKVFFKISGDDSEHLRPVVVDLKSEQGKEIFIRLVDQQTGGWGHINFDDFKFFAERPRFADEFDPKKQVAVPEADKVLYDGLSPEDAVAKMTLPPGFKATLFAGEPDVKQPIAFAIDDRGRLWVAEAYTYPKRAPEGEGKDRILVFEDTDGDGKFNKRTVFAENLNLVSGIEIGFGGVFVGAAPYLMFFPVNDWDNPKATGKPEILLDGWDFARDTHETLNSFKWGPDGWLYGCHGVFCPSNVGKPGAPESERQWMDAGIWRYHPTKKIFEVFAEGTSNPWGFDFDEHGQLIEEACVIPHLFHMIQGGRYQRQGGSHFAINADELNRFQKNREGEKTVNPFIYDDIKTIADHVHYAGDKGPHAGNGRSDSAGGGHAHAGLLIYQGDNWPEEYRGKIFMNNIHGACINQDVPERKGSGFVGHHAPNPINFNDSWSQIINLQSGPDGAVYMIDWYDKNQCHHNDVNGHDRSNGRIFKISYMATNKVLTLPKNNGEEDFVPSDLGTVSDDSLGWFLQTYPNDEIARHAMRILAERAYRNSQSPVPGIHDTTVRHLLDLLNPADQQVKLTYLPSWSEKVLPQVYQLRALWSLHVANGLTEEIAMKVLQRKKDPYIRAWTIQLLCEDKKVSSEILKEFVRLAREDKSPVVRLYLASALQRLSATNRREILEALNSHFEDANDQNIPLMVWYAIEPLVSLDTKRALQMAEKSALPNILNFTVRRVAAIGTPEAMAEIVKTLVAVSRESTANQKKNQPRSHESQPQEKKISEILNGLSLALKGQRSAPMPESWNAIEEKFSENPNAEIRAQVQSLSLTFGSSNALAALRKTVQEKSADLNARRTALESLLGAKDSALVSILQNLLGDSDLRGAALRGLASYEDMQTPEKILRGYNTYNAAEKRDALNTLSARASFGKPLLAAIADGKISNKDLSADLIRQLRNLKNDEVNQQIEKVYGVVHESNADKKSEVAKYKKIYHEGGSLPGDASRGRLIFSKICQQCHTLFDVGGKVGPDLTGSNRADLDYILQNIIDPNAVIPNDYRAWNLETKDDRVVTGIVKKQDEKSVTILTPTETLTIPRGEIASLKQNELSMMPEGLLSQMKEQEVRDLIYYLGQPGQVSLPTAGK